MRLLSPPWESCFRDICSAFQQPSRLRGKESRLAEKPNTDARRGESAIFAAKCSEVGSAAAQKGDHLLLVFQWAVEPFHPHAAKAGRREFEAIGS